MNQQRTQLATFWATAVALTLVGSLLMSCATDEVEPYDASTDPDFEKGDIHYLSERQKRRHRLVRAEK